MSFQKGRAKTGGRRQGTPNITTRELAEAAREHGPAAVARLVHLMHNAQNETTQVAAIKELLDRGFGKATQLIAGQDEDGESTPMITRIELVAVDPPNYPRHPNERRIEATQLVLGHQGMVR